jgi:hypothetical protein
MSDPFRRLPDGTGGYGVKGLRIDENPVGEGCRVHCCERVIHPEHRMTAATADAERGAAVAVTGSFYKADLRPAPELLKRFIGTGEKDQRQDVYRKNKAELLHNESMQR